jgi:hypothetical protein
MGLLGAGHVGLELPGLVVCCPSPAHVPVDSPLTESPEGGLVLAALYVPQRGEVPFLSTESFIPRRYMASEPTESQDETRKPKRDAFWS